MEPVRPHHANIQPGTLFSYAMFSLEEGVWKHFDDRWLVVDAGEPLKYAGTGPAQSVLMLNQHGRCVRMHLYPSDRLVVHCG